MYSTKLTYLPIHGHWFLGIYLPLHSLTLMLKSQNVWQKYKVLMFRVACIDSAFGIVQQYGCALLYLPRLAPPRHPQPLSTQRTWHPNHLQL